MDADATLGATLTLGLDAPGMQPIYQTSLAGLHSVVCSITPNIIVLNVEIGEDNGINQMQQLKFPDGNDSDASLDNYISQLRKIFSKGKSVNIVTIPKIGFKLEIS